MSNPSKPIWRKVVWWLGIVVSFNLTLFLVLPKVAALFVERQIEAFGLKNVNVEFEYPGLRQTVIPIIAFHKEMGTETAVLTIRGLTLNYDLHELAVGYLKEVRIEQLHLDITGNSKEPRQSLSSKPSTRSIATPLAFLSQPQPDLPLGQFSLGKAVIFREQATGPLRRLAISGVLQNENGTLSGTLTFQGIQGNAYTLQTKINPLGEMKIVLDSKQGVPDPLLNIESSMNVSEDSGIHWQGTMRANLKRATPFLALLMPIGPDLERVNGKVMFQWDGSSRHMESLQGMLRDDSTQLHGVVEANVELPAWKKMSENISIKVFGELDANSTEMKLDLSPNSSVAAMLNPQEFPLKEQRQSLNLQEAEPIRIQLNDIVQSRISLDQEDPKWTIDGPIRFQYGKKDSPIGIDATITNASGQLLDPLSTRANTQFVVWGALPSLMFETLHVQDANWMVAGQMSLENQVIQVALAEGASMETSAIQFHQGKANQLALQVNQPALLTYDLPLESLKVGPTSAQLLLKKFQWSNHTISPSKIELQLQEAIQEEEEWTAKGTLKIFDVQTMLKDFIPPSTNLAIGFDANQEILHAGIVAETTDKLVRFKGRLEHHLHTHRGKFQATLTPEAFSPSTTTLRRLIKPWKHPFDLTTGQIGVSIACGWKPTTPNESSSIAITRGDVTVALKQIGGYYENVLVAGVNATVKIIANDVKNFATLSPSTVSVRSLNAGIEVQNTSFELNLRMGEGDTFPTADLENFSANLFGGQISSPRIYVDLNRSPSLFTVKLDGIQLRKLLELEQQKGLNGTGILDGVIPIALSPTSVEIANGRIEARAPGGTIQFQPQEETVQTLVKANPQMEIVLQSLRNFHYDVLQAQVNYQADGTLNLATRLEGKNPDLQGARPVHFNLNVEENIPALLKSLRVVKGIEEKIEKFFQGPNF